MKKILRTCTLGLALTLSGWAAEANSGKSPHPHTGAHDLPDHDPIGKPGNGAEITRTIAIDIKETASGYMLFEPDAISIENGSVVRFVIRNPGALDHEFFLGSFNEIEKHQIWMRNHPDMKHQDANAVAIPSGETAELVWKFSSKTNLEFACLIPGHRDAGMWGVIIVHDHLAPKSKS